MALPVDNEARSSGAVFTLAAVVIAATVAACSLDQLLNGGKSSAQADAGESDAGDAAAVEAGITGAACGVDSESGANLCRATSMCPTVVVDSQAFPHCGFRIKNGAAELVCACGQSICSMGPFTTCSQAAGLLTSQTESQTCVQVAEGRCTENAGASSSGSSGTSTSSGSGSPTCDKTCLAECGGGAACAQVCGC